MVEGAKWTRGGAKFLPAGGAHGQRYAINLSRLYIFFINKFIFDSILILSLIQTDGTSIGHDILQKLVLTHSLRLNAINLPFRVLLRHVIIYHKTKLLDYEK